MPYPYSAKIILESFHYLQCAIHENSRSLSHDDRSEQVQELTTCKYPYLCIWEDSQPLEKDLCTGVQYGKAEFSACITKYFPSIFPYSFRCILRPCSCSCFPLHHTEDISLPSCLVIPANPMMVRQGCFVCP